MAKKSTKGEFSFSEIGSLMQDISKSVPIIIADDNEEKNKKFLDTGIYILNAALSGSIFGGVQSNRITTFAGDSGVGKSFLCYSIIKNAQKDGWNTIYIDTEFSIERAQLPNYGIDITPEKFMLIRSNIVEDIIKVLTQTLEKLKEAKRAGKDIPRTMIYVDSVGMLASRKEAEDAKDGKETVDMTRAKKLASLFRIVNGDLGYLGIPLICTNHVYDEMSMFPKKIMKGGKGLYYSSSVVSFLSKAKLKTGVEDDMDLGSSGIKVTFKTEKNRLAKPKKVKFDISFVEGCNPFKGLEAFCRPEFFDEIGIAKGKWEEYKKPIEDINEETGEVLSVKYGEFKPGGTRYYVRHLGKSVFEKQLFNSNVFTDEVLKKMDLFIQNYFQYKSLQEIDNFQSQYTSLDGNDEENGIDDDDISASDLFG
jgi:RecA/RadA recombinase